jgi:ubiquinone/menaquinone biosynthesis C-methylase UbiE
MKYLFRKFADNQNKNSISYKLRKNRFNHFVKILGVKETDNILDVGGAEEAWIGSGFEKKVTLLNLSFDNENKDFNYVLGDACNMAMFPDKSFDVIYSNSVIEHVGKKRKSEFAKEIKRVGKKYWVQTPYKHFPIEPHLVFPMFQYLPEILQKSIAVKWPYSHYKMGSTEKEVILDEVSKIYLLNKKELSYLFPGSKIFEEKFFGITKSIVAYKN